MGLIVRGDDGSISLLHAGRPRVRQEEIRSFLRTYLNVSGMIFLRLRDNARELAKTEVERMALDTNVPSPSGQERSNDERRARRRP